jgi:hypothetical protein
MIATDDLTGRPCPKHPELRIQSAVIMGKRRYRCDLRCGTDEIVAGVERRQKEAEEAAAAKAKMLEDTANGTAPAHEGLNDSEPQPAFEPEGIGKAGRNKRLGRPEGTRGSATSGIISRVTRDAATRQCSNAT